ncbi:VWA domain-containing protein, partial [Marinicauda algicola]
MPTLKASPAQLLGAVLAIAALCAPAAAQDPAAPEAAPAVPEGDGQAILVIDASNSMWGQIDGVAKIEIAREAVSGLLDRWNPEVELGVMAYGHRREGDCTDIELVAPVGAERPVVDTALASLTPRGKTPMTDAVAQAAEALSHADRPATVILVSDGRETCNADPCAVASELERSGVAFTAHVVGFDVADEETIAQLQCIAENTGGRYVAADSAEELSVALVETGGAAASEPEPAPEPAAQPSVTLEAPEQAVMGSSFVVAWSASEQNPDDYVTIVPAGAEEGTYEDYARVRDDSEASLQAPAEPGLYEVRYVLKEGRVTLA